MKKFLVLIAATALVVAIALPSFAAETTFSGIYRVRSVMDYNWDKQVKDMGNLGPAHNDPLYTGYFDQRFQLKITHTRSEFLKAVVVASIVDDTWGQQRNLRWNNSTGVGDGWIDQAWIEAIIPNVGMIIAGASVGRGFGFGLWSSGSMLDQDGTNNYGATYAIQLPVGEGNFIGTLGYIKYVDFVQPVILNVLGGVAPAGTAIRTWPGRATLDEIGGPGSSSYNVDTDTLVLTAHYISDNIKAGILFQWVSDPRANAATLLAKGIANQPIFPGATFAGEYGIGGYAGPGWAFADVLPVPGELYQIPALPMPALAYLDAFGSGDMILNSGYNLGIGGMGMYDVDVFIAGVYADVKFFDGKLRVKGEFDRIFGSARMNGYGDSYNAFLDDIQNMVIGTPGPATAFGTPTFFAGTTLLPGQRLPDKIAVDTVNAYVDVSFNTDLFTIGAAFLYGSGEKWYHPFTKDHLGLNNTGIDEFRWSNIIVSGGRDFLNSAANPLGLGNTEENVTSAKLYWSVCPIDSLDIHGAFVWAKYSEPVGRWATDANGNLVDNWNAFYGHPMNYAYGNYTNLTGGAITPAGVSDDLGWEIDFGVTWTIMEGLTLNSEFGVLFTGDAFDYRNTVTGEREEWGEIYRWVNTLTFEF
jgi:hypothetical protein